jgi:hypothetical protein
VSSQQSERTDSTLKELTRRNALPPWFAAEYREYRHLIAGVGLPSLVFARITGEAFERRIRDAVIDMIMRGMEYGGPVIGGTKTDLLDELRNGLAAAMTAEAAIRKLQDALLPTMTKLGYDERHLPFFTRGFNAAVKTTTRRLLPLENPRESLNARADALLMEWKRLGLTECPSSVDEETRDAVIRKLERKQDFRQRLTSEVEAYAAALAEESGKRKADGLNRRQRERLRDALDRETGRIW